MRHPAYLTLVAVSAFGTAVRAAEKDTVAEIVDRLSRLAAAETDLEGHAVAQGLALRLGPISQAVRELDVGGLAEMRAVAEMARSWIDRSEATIPRDLEVGEHHVRWLGGSEGRVVVQVTKPMAPASWVARRVFALELDGAVDHIGTTVARPEKKGLYASWSAAEPAVVTISRDLPETSTQMRFHAGAWEDTLHHDKARDVYTTHDATGATHIQDMRAGTHVTIPPRAGPPRR